LPSSNFRKEVSPSLLILQNGMIHAVSLSDETKRDGAVAPNLIREVGEINSLITDSGYDEIKVYQTALNHMKPNGKIIIHPRSNAVVSANKKAALRQRNQHVKEIQSRGILGALEIFIQQSVFAEHLMN
jgi:hypothetical protein